MDDMNAFERQVVGQIHTFVGPSRPVNDDAIFTAITTSQSPRRRFQSMFSAGQLVVAGAVVALFGGFLLIAQPFQQNNASVPGAATDPLVGIDDPRVATVTGHLKSGYGQGCEDCGARLEMDDARLSGDVTFTFSIDWWDGSTDPAGEGPSLFLGDHAHRERRWHVGGDPPPPAPTCSAG